MMKLKNIFDITFWKFIFVGMINTLVGTSVMFLAYNIMNFNYWISSALNYIIGSICSYLLNKNFTFKNKSKDQSVVFKFIINITVCYLLAYGMAKPIVRFVLSDFSIMIQENVAMIVGMCLFIILNYIGQRFWAFKETKGE